MKILVEMTDEEYMKFRLLQEDIRTRNERDRFKKERDNLMKLIEKELPNKSLIISCTGFDRPAEFKLEDK